ncbi:MAG: hypothetical protein CSA62_00280 [Planctomycetota bacterium]|nr:MAG: hypothetical protein CSA62_00280 [Planctomycetota bacterium]
MRLALVTQRDLPEWEVDDRPFHAALASHGIEAVQEIWDDPEVAWGAYDGVLLRTVWDYFEKAPAFLAWSEEVAAESRLWNPVPVLRWNHDKRYLRELESVGFAIAPTEWFEADASDIEERLRARAWERALLKPAVGATSIGTLRFQVDAAGMAKAKQQLSRQLRDCAQFVQQYQSSVETLGELSAIFLAGQFSHGIRKLPVSGDYRTQDDHGAKDEPYVIDSLELSVAKRLLRYVEERFELEEPLLYARVDWLRGAGGELLLNELELIEPSLFFRHSPRAAESLARELLRRLSESL